MRTERLNKSLFLLRGLTSAKQSPLRPVTVTSGSSLFVAFSFTNSCFGASISDLPGPTLRCSKAVCSEA